jgi:cytochrome c553
VTLAAALLAAALAAPPAKAQACAGCHGADGNSTDPAIPSLAGQRAAYLALQLVQYRDGRRQDPRMTPAAKDLSDADVDALAGWYAARPPSERRRAAAPEALDAGRKVLEANHCGSCHRPDLSGQAHVPRLTGLSHDYLLKEMRGFRAQTRAELDGSMTMAAQALSDDDIVAVVRYIASLPATAPRDPTPP